MVGAREDIDVAVPVPLTGIGIRSEEGTKSNSARG